MLIFFKVTYYFNNFYCCWNWLFPCMLTQSREFCINRVILGVFVGLGKLAFVEKLVVRYVQMYWIIDLRNCQSWQNKSITTSQVVIFLFTSSKQKEDNSEQLFNTKTSLINCVKIMIWCDFVFCSYWKWIRWWYFLSVLSTYHFFSIDINLLKACNSLTGASRTIQLCRCTESIWVTTDSLFDFNLKTTIMA